MKWRVMLELVGADGTVGIHEVSGGAAVAEYARRPRDVRWSGASTRASNSPRVR